MDLYFKNINIMNNIKKVKIDIGLSYNAPHSNLWLDNDTDLIVFGFEPDIDSVNCILSQNIVKKQPSHGTPIKNEYINTRFFIMPVALDNVIDPIEKDFYVLQNDCGTSSLYHPHSNLGEIRKIYKVPVFSLKHFFDIFPWDRFEYIEYIKIDAQGADLNILKSAQDYIKKIVYITAEPEHNSYDNTETNNIENITSYLEEQNFIKIIHPNTIDPTYINKNYLHLKDSIYICQCG